MASSDDRLRRYWRIHLRYLALLLTIWFAVSYGAAILFVDALDEVRVFGFPLGFWFAQQGAIFVFVLLILAYVLLMNRLDRRFGFDEGPGSEDPGAEGSGGDGGEAE